MNFLFQILATVMALLTTPFFSAGQTTWFVDQNATGNGDGKSWPNGFTEVQSALSIAVAGDQVWVAAGLFTPDPNGSNRAKRFELPNGVKFYGGFTGSEISLSQRDLTNGSSTILSGNVGNPNDSTDNSFTVLYLAYPDTSTLVDGFVIRHGFAKSDTSSNFSGPTLCGGGAFVQSAYGFGYATFKNCTFRDNFALSNGGGVCISGKKTLGNTPVFHDCQFINNRTGRHGGGLFWEGGNDWDRGLEFLRVSFLGNVAKGTVPFQAAGCARMQKNFGKDTINLNHCTAIKNIGNAFCGCFYVEADDNLFLGVSVENSEFAQNEVPVLSISAIPDLYSFQYSNNPGVPVRWFHVLSNNRLSKSAVYVPLVNQEVGSLYSKIDSASTSVSFGNRVENQIEGTISLMYLSNKNSWFRGNRFFNCQYVKIQDENESWFEKSRIFIDNRFLNPIKNNQFIDCFVGIRIDVNPGTNFQLTNNVFYRCNFEEGGFVDWPPDGKVENNIFYKDTLGNPMTSLPFPNNPAAVNTFVFRNNLSEIPQDTLDKYAPGGGGNLLNIDPDFVDAGAKNLRLSPCSPLLNKGTNEPYQNQTDPIDFDGNSRIQDGQVDIGAFERGALALAQTAEVSASCGENPSGSVQFLMENGCPPYAFQWSNGAQTGTDTIGLAAGSYVFTISDSQGKQATTAIDIPGSDPMPTISGDQFVCADAVDAILAATITGAAEPVSYLWNTGATQPGINNLSEGEYILTATDANGCTGKDTAYVGVAIPTTVQHTINNATGPLNADGSIQINSMMGIPPFQFDWSNGDTTDNPTKLLPGLYSLTITNGIGCAEVFNFGVDFTISTGAAWAQSGATVQPNPASERVFLEWGAFDQFELFEPSGRRIMFIHWSGNRSDITVGGLPDGAYLFTFSQKTGEKLSGHLFVAH